MTYSLECLYFEGVWKVLLVFFSSFRKLPNMPQCCSVPYCSNRSSGHKFPANKTMLMKWLVAIRRDHFKPTKFSRVCKLHFTTNDFELPKESILQNPVPKLKSSAVPSVFKWTKEASLSDKRREQRASSRLKRFQAQLNHMPCVADEKNGIDIDSSTNYEPNFSDPYSLDITPAVVEVESSSKNVGIQCSLLTGDNVKVSSDVNNSSHYDSTFENVSTTKNVSEKKVKLRIESLRSHPKMLQFYTGFDDYDHFIFVFNLFGDKANNLKYYPSMQPSLQARVLSPADEFLMTLMKLRCSMSNTELAFLFGVSKSSVSNIFITWINFLYCQFKDLDIWAPRSVIESNLRFRGKDCPCTIILDCTEVKIEKPKNPEAQQLTYSTYKSANTLKVLIGISPTGTVTYVSDAYGGAVSDREIFEKSGLIDVLQDGDIILCDRGFNVQDLVAHKNVTVNMPEFLDRNSAQFKAAQIRKSKKVSSQRIHVEGIIGLAKTYKILSCKLKSTLVTLGSRIIFVCFMLTNFRSNIIL